MTSLTLDWQGYVGDSWCRLESMDLQDQVGNDIEGVYLIWHGGSDPHTVYIGQGKIKDCLIEHRTDPRVLEFSDLILFVTWASVKESDRDGVVRFMAENWRPKVGAILNSESRIEVNSPFDRYGE